MNWLYTLWYGYVWPSLKGNGPEAVVQTVVYGAIAMVLIPPVRKWWEAKFSEVHSKLDEAHAKLDHVIRHSPDIPDFPAPTPLGEDSKST
jgi:hypothetical protein